MRPKAMAASVGVQMRRPQTHAKILISPLSKETQKKKRKNNKNAGKLRGKKYQKYFSKHASATRHHRHRPRHPWLAQGFKMKLNLMALVLGFV